MSFSQKHPYLAAILSGLLCTFMTGTGMAVSQILGLYEQSTYMVMAATIAVSAGLGILIMRKSGFILSEFGFNRKVNHNAGKVWFYLPLIIIELTPVAVFGFSSELSSSLFLAIALLTIAVGFNEEIFFRGLALKFLGEKGSKKAIVWSSVIFGVLHIGNAFSGRDMQYIILQVAFAFLVGIVLAELVTITKNLWIVIIWHFSHDFIAIATGGAIDSIGLTVLAIQVALLLVYAVGLWKKAVQEESIAIAPVPLSSGSVG